MISASTNMGPVIEIITSLPSDLNKLHLTFVTSEGTFTFASDNAEYLHNWWLVQCAKLANPERRDEFWIVLNKREFTAIRDSNTGLPIKRLSSCVFKDGSFKKLKADVTRYSFNTDHETGRPLPLQTDIVFVDFV